MIQTNNYFLKQTNNYFLRQQIVERKIQHNDSIGKIQPTERL
jgi:hypothetical protein